MHITIFLYTFVYRKNTHTHTKTSNFMKNFENYLVKNQKAKCLSIEEIGELGYYYYNNDVEIKYYRAIKSNKIIVLRQYKEVNITTVTICNICNAIRNNAIIESYATSFHCNSLSDFKNLLKLAYI